MKKLLFFLAMIWLVFPSLAVTNGFCNINYHFNSNPIQLSNDRFSFSFTRDGACWDDSIKLKLDLDNAGCSVKKVYVLLKDGYHESEKVNAYYYLGKFGIGGPTRVTIEFEYDDTVTFSNIRLEVKNVGASNVYGSICDKKISFGSPVEIEGNFLHQLGIEPIMFSNTEVMVLNWNCALTSNVAGLQYSVVFNPIENFQIDSIKFNSNTPCDILNGNEFILGTFYIYPYDCSLSLFGKALANQEEFVLPFITSIKDPLNGFEVVGQIKDTLRLMYVAPITASILNQRDQSSIQLFPNPVKLNSDITIESKEPSVFQLIDGQGRVIESGKLEEGINKILISKVGLYQLRIGESEVHKVVVE